jgi:hypothetical protein
MANRPSSQALDARSAASAKHHPVVASLAALVALLIAGMTLLGTVRNRTA